jgi:hypothetical protein
VLPDGAMPGGWVAGAWMPGLVVIRAPVSLPVAEAKRSSAQPEDRTGAGRPIER